MDSAGKLNIELFPPGVLRPLTPAQKFAAAHALREAAWDISAAGVRMHEPHLNEAEVQARVRARFLRATS